MSDAPPTPTTTERGRPIVGAIAGLFFGLFLTVDLIMFGVIAFESALVLVIPIIGLLAGIALGIWAPLKRGASETG